MNGKMLKFLFKTLYKLSLIQNSKFHKHKFMNGGQLLCMQGADLITGLSIEFQKHSLEIFFEIAFLEKVRVDMSCYL